MKYTYMISNKYCDTWTITHAIREIIANAIDAGGEIETSWDKGKATVTNLGCKLETNHLLLGESSKRDDNSTIGQFGEGFKIAALVFVREGRNFHIRSGNKKFEFFMKFDENFGKNILGVNVTDLDKLIEGTYVGFQCTEDEFIQAKNLFRKFNPPTEYTSQILDKCGEIYIMGVNVVHDSGYMFGYDLNHKTLINRDRTVLDSSELSSAISKVLSQCKDSSVITKLVKNGHDSKYHEFSLSFYPTYESKQVWKDILNSMYEDKVAITSEDTLVDRRAEYLGYKVVDCGSLVNGIMKWSLDFPSANKVTIEKVSRYLSTNELNESERKSFNSLLDVYKYLYESVPWEDVRVTEDLGSEVKAQREDKIIYLNRNLITDFDLSFTALIHECAHITSCNSMDCSESFENELTEYTLKLAKKFGVERS